ncbi:MAG: methyltransferase domain-containing protein [Chloroflexota bacterium]|nr:methyltransferase domain-containing protein [Chloroflexota bacterium]
MATTATVDETKLNDFMGKMINDLGAAANAPLVLLGDKLGLFKALAEAGPLSSADLAQRTGTTERYVREWLAAQAASGYVDYDPDTDRYAMSPEQATALADEQSPVFLAGIYDSLYAMLVDEPTIREAFRTGRGVGWHEHNPCLFSGTERFFRTGYQAHLIQEWLPALDGVVAKLERGATVADVGCGHGASTILMAEAFPRSTFVGFDYHDASIARAREAAEEAGVAQRVRFEVAPAKDYPGNGYDLVTFFDCLHDMGHPVGAAAHVRETLAPDGTWMIVEPYAGDSLTENLNPVGRLFYAASTMLCTPASLSQEVGLGLGAQAGEARLRDVVTQGGFTRFRRATETPFNLILEARP